MIRIDHFMNCEEISPSAITKNKNDLPIGTIQIINGDFAWETVKSAQHYYDEL